MLGNEALMEFLRKILPDETDEEKMEEKARKLAIRKLILVICLSIL